MTLKGKGFFIWKIPNCENGNPQAIADLAQDAKLTHVLIKIADTNYSYNVLNGIDLVPPVAQALRARGIQVLGWHYVKGYDPIGAQPRDTTPSKLLPGDWWNSAYTRRAGANANEIES